MHASLFLPLTHQGSIELTRLRALFDYDAASEEELSFPEGAIIELVRTDDNDVDDGWWEGRYQGKVGVFPSIVVEVVDRDHIDNQDVSDLWVVRGLHIIHMEIVWYNTGIRVASDTMYYQTLDRLDCQTNQL